MPYDPYNPFAYDPNEVTGFGSGMGIQQVQGPDQGGAYGNEPAPYSTPVDRNAGEASWMPSARDYNSWITSAQNSGRLNTPFQTLFGTRDPRIPTGNDPASAYEREMAQYMQGYTDPYGGTLSVRPEYDWRGQDPTKLAGLASTPIADRFRTNYGVLSSSNSSVPSYLEGDPNAEYVLRDDRTGDVVFQGSGVDAARQVAMGGTNFAKTQGANSRYSIYTRPQGSTDWNLVGSDVEDTKASAFLDSALPMLALAIPGIGPAIAGAMGLGGAGAGVAAGLAAGAGSLGSSIINQREMGDALVRAGVTGLTAGVTTSALNHLLPGSTPSAADMNANPSDAFNHMIGPSGLSVDQAAAALRASGVSESTVSELAAAANAYRSVATGSLGAGAADAAATTVGQLVVPGVRGGLSAAAGAGAGVAGLAGALSGASGAVTDPVTGVTTVDPITSTGTRAAAAEPNPVAAATGALGSVIPPSTTVGDLTTVAPLVINAPRAAAAEPNPIGAGALAAGLNNAGPAIDPGTGLPVDATGGGSPSETSTPAERGPIDWLKLAELIGKGLGIAGGLTGAKGGTMPGGMSLDVNDIFHASLPVGGRGGSGGSGGGGGGVSTGNLGPEDFKRYAFGPEKTFVRRAAHGGSMRSSFAVEGPGTGRSDDIPAVLSDGEYVMDAETVALLGDGSSKAGAKRLDELRVNIRKHKGRELAKGRFSVGAKKPASYMAGGRT